MPRATAKPSVQKAGGYDPADPDNAEPTDLGELAVVKTETGGWTDDLFASYDDTEEHLNVLYWGREGSGKTIDIASATQLGKVLVVNAEGGLKRRALLDNGVNTENLVIFPRPGQPLTYHSLEQAIFRIKSDLMDDPKSWFLFAIDSVTDLFQNFTDEVSDENFAKNKRKNPNWEPGVGDEFFTDRGDYGVSTKMIRKLVRMLRDLPVHVALTTLERRDVDEDTSKVAYGPAVGPALQTSLLGYVDVVLYCKAPDEDRDYFRAQTKKIGAARAKDRIGILPKVLVNPTFPRLLAYNEGTLAEDTDPQQEILAQAPAPKKTPARKPAAARATRGAKTAAKSTEAKEEAGEPASEGETDE